MQTPAKGSPFLRRTRRMSPTFADSVFSFEKRLLRAPVGSRIAIWVLVKSSNGSLHTALAEGGGG